MDDGTRAGRRWIAAIVGLAALSLLPGIGSTRLSYHEAIVAQGAREMVAAGDWLVPTLDARPWLEKPPGLHWLVVPMGHLVGDVTELVARWPSVLAAIGVCLAVFVLASRHLGPTVGGLAGCVQATAVWLAIRGRLAESDMLLACLVAWTMVALDRLRFVGSSPPSGSLPPCGRGLGWGVDRPASPDVQATRPPTLPYPTRGEGKTCQWTGRRTSSLPFLLLLASTALAKGIGFGAALIVATTAVLLVWDRDRATLRALFDPIGLAMAALVAMAWPLVIASRYPEALGLWTSHVADRMADRPEVFAGRSPWWAYAPVVLTMTLPWTPLALVGMRRGSGRPGLDRLLWAWAVVPMVLLSIASVKNPHYAIHALPPWSIWAAIGLARAGEWLRAKGRSPERLRRRLAFGFVALAAGLGIGLGIVAPRFDRRSVEWGFYRTASDRIGADEPLVLLYDEWDRLPYPTPFGPVPHDLAVRLYYLNRPASWRQGEGDWKDLPARPFAAIARERDLPALRRLGGVETISQGPTSRWDRTYVLIRINPESNRDPDVRPASSP